MVLSRVSSKRMLSTVNAVVITTKMATLVVLCTLWLWTESQQDSRSPKGLLGSGLVIGNTDGKQKEEQRGYSSSKKVS